MIKDVFENYEAFGTMVLSATIMSNAQTKDYRADAGRIIRFIAGAYGFTAEFTDECERLILDELSRLGKTTDRQVVYAARKPNGQYGDMDSLFDIKGDALAAVQEIGKQPGIREGWFDYNHYKTYQANIRFEKINAASAGGNVILVRQAGILHALGIGCEKNLDKAELRLMQCAIWGDIPSMRLVSAVYKAMGEDKKAEVYREVADISAKYLYAGCTVIPPFDKHEYSDKAREIYALVSSVRQDVVRAYDKYNVDFSFVEALRSPELDYYKRMEFINNYSGSGWKEVTNASVNPSTKVRFGF